MIYKGQLQGFLEEVVEKMLEYQVAQGNKRDVSVFEKHRTSNSGKGGFFGVKLMKVLIFGMM